MNINTQRRNIGPILRFVHDLSFAERGAPRLYDAAKAIDPTTFANTFMPDEVTRDTAKRMHYAAYRASKARCHTDAERWRKIHYKLRDHIVIGNRKLVYRAVRQRMAMSNQADDLMGDCHIVLIHAVSAFNPWMGIRFSTYAFTCLARALSRLWRRAANDRLARAVSFDAFPDGEPGELLEHDVGLSSWFRIDEFLSADHPLLSDREKTVIRRRFSSNAGLSSPTLENVGRELGLSKERVRQVQASAIGKLRVALAKLDA